MLRHVISGFKDHFGGLHFTLEHTGKMAGLHSLSTSVLNNPNCMKRRENGATICAHCFAAAMMKRYKNLRPCLQENGRILSGALMAPQYIPVTTTAYFRFESFGDLINWIQAVNYFEIARANKHTRFALWTKNPWLISEAIAHGYKKPSNLNIVLSSPFLNRALNPEAIAARFPFVDAIFTVYNKDFAAANGITINCGARSCATCGRCYKKAKTGSIMIVNELLKGSKN